MCRREHSGGRDAGGRHTRKLAGQLPHARTRARRVGHPARPASVREPGLRRRARRRVHPAGRHNRCAARCTLAVILVEGNLIQLVIRAKSPVVAHGHPDVPQGVAGWLRTSRCRHGAACRETLETLATAQASRSTARGTRSSRRGWRRLGRTSGRSHATPAWSMAAGTAASAAPAGTSRTRRGPI